MYIHDVAVAVQTHAKEPVKAVPGRLKQLGEPPCVDVLQQCNHESARFWKQKGSGPVGPHAPSTTRTS